MASYSPVYSAAFIEYSAATPNESFDVPAGFTAVIREFTTYDEAGGFITWCYIQNSAAAPGFVVASLQGVGVAQYDHWQGRIVVPGGGIISINASVLGNDGQIYVGGYLIRNVLP